MKVQLIVGSGYGMLNPVNLRENGWDTNMWLEVVERVGTVEILYKVNLPSGSSLWVEDKDIQRKLEG
jgi:hypothetical protein